MFKFPFLTPLDFCLWGWMKSEVYKRWIAWWRFGCCCPHKGTWRSVQMSNMWSSRTSFNVLWGWWGFRTFIV